MKPEEKEEFFKNIVFKLVIVIFLYLTIGAIFFYYTGDTSGMGFYLLTVLLLLIFPLMALLLTYSTFRARDVQFTSIGIDYRKGTKTYSHSWREVSEWKIIGKTVSLTFSNGDKAVFPEIYTPTGKAILDRCMSHDLIDKKKEEGKTQ